MHFTVNPTSTDAIEARVEAGAFRPDRWLLPARGPSRFVGLFALAMAASTVLHTAVFILDDQPWSGPVSWRKPIVFSLSFALLAWAFGWVLDRLPHRARTAWSLAVVFTLFSTIEVGLITMQQWRGRPSHFNVAESGDAAVFSAMAIAVIFISLAIVGLTIWSLIQRPADPLERTIVFAGLALIITGLGLGQWIVQLGNDYVSRFDEVPETVLNGDAGVAKFPHAVAFHGIQVFMVAGAMLRRSVAAGTVRASGAGRLLRAIVAAYVGAMVFSVLQSFGGRAPFDLDVASGALLAASLAGLALTGAATLTSWWRTRPIGTDPINVRV